MSNRIKQEFYRLINKLFGEHCQKCGKKKYSVRRYGGVCPQCFHKKKYKDLSLKRYRRERRELRKQAHRLIDKIVAKEDTNYKAKSIRKKDLYKWLERNDPKGHFKQMRSHDEIKAAIKKLKKYYKKM